MSLALTAVCLLTLAAAHSFLGERLLLPGFLSGRGDAPGRLPPSFARAVLRVAWHLTSVAWVGLAVVVLRWPAAAPAVGLTMALSGALLHLATRGAHPAWLLFMLGALGVAFSTAPGIGRAWVASAGVAVSLALATLHFAWAGGLRWGLSAALPQVNGQPTFTPGRLATAAVGVALLVLGAVFAARAGWLALPLSQVGAGLAALLFGLRTVGDFRTVGLFKRVTGSRFARLDSLAYTPLCFALAAALCWVGW